MLSTTGMRQEFDARLVSGVTKTSKSGEISKSGETSKTGKNLEERESPNNLCPTLTAALKRSGSSRLIASR